MPLSGSTIGYIRQSGDAPDREAVRRLAAFGAGRIVPGVSREDLAGLVASLAAGDVLVVASLDHLAVSMWRVFDMLDELQAREVAFVSIDEGVDTREERVSEALDLMRSVLAAERRLVARRSAEGRSEGPPPAANDPLLERSRRVAAPWLDAVRAHRPQLTWEQLVEHVAQSGADVSPLSASLMRRHVRRLVEAGDLPASVLDRAQRAQEDAAIDAGRRARAIAAEHPEFSLREIGLRLEGEGLLPPRADSWSAQTVKRLLAE